MGITIITATLIVLLSAFNGIETMIENLYSEFDTDLTIRVEKGKSFNEERIDMKKLAKLEGVKNHSRVVEEVVILKRDKKWVSVNMLGVEPSFLKMTNMADNMAEGEPNLREEGEDRAILGAGVLGKLEGYVPKQVGVDMVDCYVPKRDAKIRPGKSPFQQKKIGVSGTISYNREVSSQFMIIPFDLSRELMEFDDEISAIYIDAKEGVDNAELKERVQKLVGSDFKVKTSYEKNELIYKTSQSERIIVLIILLFIFVLAAFNLVASLTMLFVEKLEDVKTMVSFGTPRKYIFRIFFIEGLLISGKGILFGLILGYAVCWAQLQFSLIKMPNSNGEAFPIGLSAMDGLLIFSLVAALSILFSYFPVAYLIRRNVKS
ncbi:MAG: ABC transporter permease [bacterium]|nr:ABC transporter permease [bacterium]